jgi:hypothetical protein
LIDEYDVHHQPKPVADLTLTEQGNKTTIRCGGSPTSDCTGQIMEIQRSGDLVLHRKTTKELRWWCHGTPERRGETLTWSDGTRLRIVRGKLASFTPNGYRDEKIVGLGKLKLRDPMPTAYPLVAARPAGGELIIEISTPTTPRAAARQRKGN